MYVQCDNVIQWIAYPIKVARRYVTCIDYIILLYWTSDTHGLRAAKAHRARFIDMRPDICIIQGQEFVLTL